MLSETNDMKRSSNNKDVFWHAVETKDARFNGTFFFAVQTTGIYCKLSCAARTPKRQNVMFFDTPKKAEQEGFRACQRCKPDSVIERDPQVEMVLKVCQLIEDDLE